MNTIECIMNRDKNIAVFKDTLEQSKIKYKYIGTIDNMTSIPMTKPVEPVGMKPKIHVTSDDCTVLIDETRRGVLIDSASLKHPGGGVRNGSNAQEECLCRQSNLYQAIEQLEFPLHNKTYGVYIPEVTFFKHGAVYSYCTLDMPKLVDVLMLFSRPRNVFKTEDESYKHHLTAFKSLVMFANKYRVEYIILPPIGSGVFGNDPNTVARALRDVLSMYPLDTVKDIYIACFNKTENYDAYTKMFQNV